jgi:hypothetical protein
MAEGEGITNESGTINILNMKELKSVRDEITFHSITNCQWHGNTQNSSVLLNIPT